MSGGRAGGAGAGVGLGGGQAAGGSQMRGAAARTQGEAGQEGLQGEVRAAVCLGVVAGWKVALCMGVVRCGVAWWWLLQRRVGNRMSGLEARAQVGGVHGLSGS